MITDHSDGNDGEPHLVRGVLISIVAVPVLLAGVALAGSALLDLTIGVTLSPGRWFSDSPVDWLYGGAQGDFLNYVRFMAGALPAYGAWAAMRWAFTGAVE